MEYLVLVPVLIYFIYEHEKNRRAYKKLEEKLKNTNQQDIEEIRKREEHFQALMEYTPEQAYRRYK